MPVRRALGASAVLLLLPVLGAGTVGEPAAGTSPRTNLTYRASLTQTVRLDALPQIVQPGGRVASADAAKAAFTATVQPVSVGRQVSLQVQRGSSWQTVATVGLDRRGRAQFAAKASAGGEAL